MSLLAASINLWIVSLIMQLVDHIGMTKGTFERVKLGGILKLINAKMIRSIVSDNKACKF